MNRDARNKAYAMVNTIRMTGKKIFLSTDPSNKSLSYGHVDGRASINSVPILVNRLNQ